MQLNSSSFLSNLDSYAFAEVDRARRSVIEQKGEDYLLDFGVGDPTDPTPPIAREAAVIHALSAPDQGYPSYNGEDFFRQAVADWFNRRFGVELNPETEITATPGSKQAVFSLPMAFVNPGDTVLIPDPGYPPYTTGTVQRGGKPFYLPLKPENNFLPDLEEIPTAVADKAAIFWLNSPNNPTTKIIPPDYFERAIAFCRRHEIILCSDEAYSEMYYDENKPPGSLLNLPDAKEVGLVFHSLSKRSNMTNYRVGFVAGNQRLVELYKQVQTNIHSGQAQLLQSAATAAYTDEQHVIQMRQLYKQRRDLLLPQLEKAGFRNLYADAGFYVWAQTPASLDGTSLCQLLLDRAGINTTPGPALAQQPENGSDFVRFALIQNLEKTAEAGRRISELQLDCCS